MTGSRTPISWTAPDQMTFEAWQEQLDGLLTVHEATPWLIGDCLNAGEERFGEDYSQALPDDRLKAKTLANYKWVANRIPASRRRERLSFGHHAELAALEADEQKRWLDRAEQEGLSRASLRQALKGIEAGQVTYGGGGAREVDGEVLAPLAKPTTEYHDADEDQLESLKRAWNKAAQSVREQFLAWVQENERPVMDHGGKSAFDPVAELPAHLKRG